MCPNAQTALCGMGYNLVKEVNKMNRKITGQILMGVGVACGVIYVLASLYRGETLPVPLSTTLLYAGIISLIAGLVFYGLAGVSGLPSGRRYWKGEIDIEPVVLRIIQAKLERI